MALRVIQRQKTLGFTLIELLLVMVLLGLTASVAMVSVNGLVSRWQERSIANDVYSALKMSRVWAISGGGSVLVEVDSDSEALAIRQGASIRRIVRLPKSMHLKAFLVDSNNSSEASAVSAAVFVFWPDGSLEGGRLHLKAGERVLREFTLNGATGRIKSS